MPGNIISIERANRSTDVFICSFSSGLVTFLVHVKLASDWNLYNTECGFQISRSRIDPSTETLTLIPRNRANEMLLIRQINSSAAVFKSDTVYKEAMPFPSGNNILMFDSGRSSMAVLFSASDRIKQEVQLSRRLPPNDSIVFSADEKALYCNTYIVQIADGAVSELSVPFEKFERADAAFVPAAGKAVTAVLLADSEYVGPEADENASAEEALIMFLENIDNMVDIPYFNIFVEGKGRGRIALPEGIALSYDKDANIFRLDGCGLLLVSGNPDSTLVAYDVTADTWRTWNTESTVVQAASGNLNKVTALLSGYSLCLADFETGTILWKAETGIIPDLVSGLWFSPDDRLLLMVYGGTRASVYRVADGQLLNDIPFVSHPEYSRISIQQDDSGLLYIYNPFSVKAGSDSLILDGATGELLGRIPGLMFVNFRTGKVYRFGKYNGRNDQTLICPLYTREKLLELAEPFR